MKLILSILFVLSTTFALGQIERGEYKAEIIGLFDYGNIDSLGNYSGGGIGIKFAGARLKAGILYSWGKMDDIPTFSKFPDLDHRVRDLRGIVDLHPFIGIRFQPIIGGEFGTFLIGVKGQFDSDPEEDWGRQYKSIYLAPTAGLQVFLSQKISVFGKARYGFLLNNIDEDFGYDPSSFQSLTFGISIHQFK